jgi:hypothetical protein
LKGRIKNKNFLKYFAIRKAHDPKFAEDYEKGYENIGGNAKSSS